MKQHRKIGVLLTIILLLCIPLVFATGNEIYLEIDSDQDGTVDTNQINVGDDFDILIKINSDVIFDTVVFDLRASDVGPISFTSAITSTSIFPLVSLANTYLSGDNWHYSSVGQSDHPAGSNLSLLTVTAHANSEGSIDLDFLAYSLSNGFNFFTISSILSSITINSASTCGNSVIDISLGEECDDTFLNGESCSSKGYAGGDLACSVGCLSFDETSCLDDDDGDGYLSNVDCDDNSPAINPGATEACTGGVDDNCDGAIDGDDAQCSSICSDSNPSFCDEGGCGGYPTVLEWYDGICYNIVDTIDFDGDGFIAPSDTTAFVAELNDHFKCTLCSNLYNINGVGTLDFNDIKMYISLYLSANP